MGRSITGQSSRSRSLRLQALKRLAAGGGSRIAASLEQRGRAREIQGHALAAGVEHAQAGAAQRFIAVACALKQRGGMNGIQGYAAAIHVQKAEMGAAYRETAIACALKQHGGSAGVGRHSLAVYKQVAE